MPIDAGRFGSPRRPQRSSLPLNFELLQEHRDWRPTWTHLVAGRFSDALFDGLLFYDQSAGYAEFHETDGNGGTAVLQTHTNWRPSWTHIVPGRFSDSPYTGLLMYDRQGGIAAVFDTDGHGNLTERRAYEGWGQRWTHVTKVRIPDSEYTGIVLYDQAAGRGEIHRCNGGGDLQLYKSSDGWRTSWTHVVGDDRSGTGLLLYEATTGHCEIYELTDDPNELGAQSIRDGMPPATEIIAGNFGWWGSGFLFYDRSTLRGAYVFLAAPGSITVGPEIAEWPTAWDVIVPANLWEPDPEYAHFQNGFADLVCYERGSGYAECWLHEPYGAVVLQDLEGYVSAGSVVPGDTMSFHVNSRVGTFGITIFRQAAEEVHMLDVPDVRHFDEAFPIRRLDYRDGPSWPSVADVVIPADWPSGLYLARVNAVEGGASTVIPFVVRSLLPGNQATTLVFIPDTTYEAYNFWGGRSLYGFRSSIDPGVQYLTWSYGSTAAAHDEHESPRAFRVSFRRPYNVDDGATWPKWQHWEVPLLRWLARQGIPVEVCTSTDIHRAGVENPNLFASYRLLVSVGHDEYWSREMRDLVESFVAGGGNAAFFSANTCWFQVRFDADVSQQICYKDVRFDPIAEAQSELTTVNWYDTPVCRAETSLTGVSYYDSGNPEPLYQVRDPNHWAFEALDPASMVMFGEYAENETLKTVVGNETDRFQPGADGCVPRSPDGFRTLAEAMELDGNGHRTGRPACTMGIFAHGAGQVFTVGTINWSLGLSQIDGSWNAIDQITRNVIDHLG